MFKYTVIIVAVALLFLLAAVLRALIGTREGLTTADDDAKDQGSDLDQGPDAVNDTEPDAAFCGVDQELAAREMSCLALDKSGCGLANCCVWATAASGDKSQELCVSGGGGGPTFLSEPGTSSLYNITKYEHAGKVYPESKPAQQQSQQPQQQQQQQQQAKPSAGQVEAVWKALQKTPTVASE